MLGVYVLFFFQVKILPSLSSIILSFIKGQKQMASLIEASLAKCFLLKFTSVQRDQCKAPPHMAYGRELQA